jgi:hypothetical protein
MAQKQPPPGFNSSGNISDPSAFVEDILIKHSKISLIGAQRAFKEYPTFKEDKTTSGNLMDNNTDGSKKYQSIDSLKLTRVSASGAKNCCWFDSFLYCMSLKYRKMNYIQRQQTYINFRNYITKNKEEIKKYIPSSYDIIKPILDEDLTDKNKEKEIDSATGFGIAWYFGVNLIYIRYKDTNVTIICDYAYQSPDCKTIIMNYTGNHFEPVGILGLDPESKFSEKESTFLFDWSDSALCPLKTIQTKCKEENPSFDKIWTEPSSCETPAPSGGKRRKTRKARRSKRKATKSRRR